eukprot:7872153-Alexandrium_andersonii.AAC.1
MCIRDSSRSVLLKPSCPSHAVSVRCSASGASSSPQTGAINSIKHPAGIGSPSQGSTKSGPRSRWRRSDWQNAFLRSATSSIMPHEHNTVKNSMSASVCGVGA